MKKWYKAHKAVDPLVLVVTVAEHTLLDLLKPRLLLISSAGAKNATVLNTGYYIADAC